MEDGVALDSAQLQSPSQRTSKVSPRGTDRAQARDRAERERAEAAEAEAEAERALTAVLEETEALRAQLDKLKRQAKAEAAG